TGLPSPRTAVGRKAEAVVAAQAQKLDTPPPIHGTARWATAGDVASLLAPDHAREAAQGTRSLHFGGLITDGGFDAGQDRDTGLPLVVRYPGHILTVAGTGQGKSATQIIANLMTYKGSVVVVDPKGELFEATARERRRFGKVFRLAPLARQGEPASDRYNPLAELDDPRELGNRARRLAEMLVVRQGAKGAAEATFFENEAINLLTALIMFVVEVSGGPEHQADRTLASVRAFCALPALAGRKERVLPRYIEDVLQRMALTSSHAYVRRQGSVFLGYEVKLLSAIISEINSNLAFWDGHPGFAEVTATSDFRFADLERETITVFLTIPFKDMATSFRFLRAMIGLAFAALEEKADARRASVLFILDEFAALRDMEFMRDAVAQMRSSGAWLWMLVQDVAQLDGVYGQWADVFLSQTDHQVFFGGTVDGKTKTHISSALGVTTFPYRDANVSWSHSVGLSDGASEQVTQMGGVNTGRNIGQSVNITEPVKLAPRPLLTPFEVGTYLSGRLPGETHASTAIVFSKQAGGYPIKMRRQHWRTLPWLQPQHETAKTGT
ncbi:MAG: type IV secretory system conjugative DNA transfer family protein, partial [Hyphomicrobiaceae bacterium]|nr:type IV secretory system conjugative DNA transfer family protein [Hyphomicrobiaceae bacterium]